MKKKQAEILDLKKVVKKLKIWFGRRSNIAQEKKRPVGRDEKV